MFRILVTAVALSCAVAVPAAFADPPRHNDRSWQREDNHRGDHAGRDNWREGRDRDRDHRDRNDHDADRDRGGRDGWRDNRRDNDWRDRRDHDRRPDFRRLFCDRDIVEVRHTYSGWRPYPPGHMRRWHVGHYLPRDVVYYELPPDLIYRLKPVPYGYRYVRVGGDILRMAIGTGLIADPIESLGRRG